MRINSDVFADWKQKMSVVNWLMMDFNFESLYIISKNIMWTLGPTDGLLKKLQAVQNAAARVTTKTRKFDHITPVLRKLHWLPVRKRIVYKLAVMVYKCLHGLAPPYLATDCVPVTSVASRRHLRSAASGCLAVTGTKTALGRRNFAVSGATIWNNLPTDLRLHSQSLLSFGQKLKQYLFEP